MITHRDPIRAQVLLALATILFTVPAQALPSRYCTTLDGAIVKQGPAAFDSEAVLNRA